MRQFYLQDSRSYCGNAMYWRSDKGGYTTNVAEARVFTLAEALALHNNRATDIPWPKEYIDDKVRPVVNMQNVSRKKARLTPASMHAALRVHTEMTNCHHCGAFMNEAQRYICGCPKCIENSQGIPE